MWAVSLCAPHYWPHSDRVVSLTESKPVAKELTSCSQWEPFIPSQPLNIQPPNWRFNLMSYCHSSEHFSYKYASDLYTQSTSSTCIYSVDLFIVKCFIFSLFFSSLQVAYALSQYLFVLTLVSSHLIWKWFSQAQHFQKIKCIYLDMFEIIRTGIVG